MLDHLAIFACPGAIIAGVVGLVMIDFVVGQCKQRVHEKCPACLYPLSIGERCVECGEHFVQADARAARWVSAAGLIAGFVASAVAGVVVCTVVAAISMAMSLKWATPGGTTGWLVIAGKLVSQSFAAGAYAMLGALPVLIAVQRARKLLVHARYTQRLAHVGTIVSAATIVGAGLGVMLTVMLAGASGTGMYLRLMLMPGPVLMCSSVVGALGMVWVGGAGLIAKWSKG